MCCLDIREFMHVSGVCHLVVAQKDCHDEAARDRDGPVNECSQTDMWLTIIRLRSADRVSSMGVFR